MVGQNSLFQKEDERRKIIVNNKELDSMSFVYYNRITYRQYDRKGL